MRTPSGRRRSGRGPRHLGVSSLATLAALVVGVAGIVATAPAAAESAGSTDDLVAIHAIAGRGPIDVYVDGELTAADVAFGQVTDPFAVADSGQHVVTLFDAVPSPAPTLGGRADAPLPPAPLVNPLADRFAHLDGPGAIRLDSFGSSSDLWWLQATSLPVLFDDCSTEHAGLTVSSSASAGASIDGMGDTGGGGFGGGDAERRTEGWTGPVVFVGSRSEPPDPSAPPPFGSFDFGTVSFEVGTERTYFGFGRQGRYGAVEVVLDCRTMRITSVRTGVRSPTYGTSRFVPLTPVRLFDTRTPAEPRGPIPSGGQVDVQVTGRAGIPSTGVTAVVMNVTATGTTAPGNVRVWPTGSDRTNTANLNVSGPGQTIPNLVTVPVGTNGRVSFFALSQLHLVADVAGYYVAADAATSGRFVPVDPVRAFDTRTPAAPSGAVGPGETLSVDLAGRYGIPSTGASAVALNLTGVGTGNPGFVTAHPGGSRRPLAANLNLTGGFDIAPNLVIVPLGDDGSIDLYSKGGAHLVGDVFGYFTGPDAASSTSGLFVPSWPTRIADTRPPAWAEPDDADRRVPPDASIDLVIGGAGDVPEVGAAAVLANLTGVDAIDRGFATLHPKGTVRPTVANLNLPAAGATRPNAVLVPLGEDGDISLYTKSGMHAVLDVFGYFTR